MKLEWITIVMACGAGCVAPEPSAADDAGIDTSGFSYAGQGVLAALSASHADQRGLTWDVGTDNVLEPGWIVQTPLAPYWGQPVAALPVTTACAGEPSCDPDFGLVACTSQADCDHGGTCTPVAATVTAPGGVPRSLCIGHSDAFVDTVYDTLTSATSFADLTSLGPPDGRFEAAVRNAITFLSHASPPVRVRVLYGDIPGGTLIGNGRSTSDVLASLTRDADPASGLHVTVGEFRSSLTSWNHAKLIAVDGTLAIVGGHNLWTQDYLEQDPVHDLSMRVRGSAAAEASRFANRLWVYTCEPYGLGSAAVSDFPASGPLGCASPFELTPVPGPGATRIITVGRLGAIGDEAADDAILALVASARTRLRLSLQDLGPPVGGADLEFWPQGYLAALVAALGRGVDIELVLTNKGAIPGGEGLTHAYSNGFTPADVVGKLEAYGAAHPELLPSGADLASLVCEKLHATSLRPSSDDTWSDGATFANHAKLAIADDQAFYLGSQNWYPSNLVELGYIVDDAAATAQLIDGYYARAWSMSARVAFAASCTP